MIFVGKCKRCKAPARFDAAREQIPMGKDRFGNERVRIRYLAPWGKKEETENDGAISVRCLCGGWGRFYPVSGRVGVQRCGSRCMASTGPSCECACGGRNHGASHAYGGVSLPDGRAGRF